jgi:hypothetical protein
MDLALGPHQTISGTFWDHLFSWWHFADEAATKVVLLILTARFMNFHELSGRIF